MGNLIRVIIIVAVVWLALAWLRRVLTQRRQHASRRPAIEAMRRCAHCDVHAPQAQMIERDGRYFCSEEHARRGPAD